MGTLGSPPTRLMAVPDKWVRPTRRPADPSVGPTDLFGGPHDLQKTFQKIPQTTSSIKTLRLGVQDKTSVDYNQSKSTGYGKMCNVDLSLLVVTDQESGNRSHPLANIRRARRPFVQHTQSLSNLHRQLDIGFYSPEARTSIKSSCFLCSTYSCATFEFLALDSAPPNNQTTGISTTGSLDLSM
jgi:hypothetical protein